MVRPVILRMGWKQLLVVAVPVRLSRLLRHCLIRLSMTVVDWDYSVSMCLILFPLSSGVFAFAVVRAMNVRLFL